MDRHSSRADTAAAEPATVKAAVEAGDVEDSEAEGTAGTADVAAEVDVVAGQEARAKVAARRRLPHQHLRQLVATHKNVLYEHASATSP